MLQIHLDPIVQQLHAISGRMGGGESPAAEGQAPAYSPLQPHS